MRQFITSLPPFVYRGDNGGLVRERINAIKLVRGITGSSLLESKRLVDANWPVGSGVPENELVEFMLELVRINNLR